MIACEKGNLQIVRYLIQLGHLTIDDINTKDKVAFRLFRYRYQLTFIGSLFSQNNQSALSLATEKGHEVVIQFLCSILS